jgi:hypothetical protein
MKNIIFVLALIFVGHAAAQTAKNPIRVHGEGATEEQAKQNAFRTAIELSVGSVVVSDRKTINGNLIKNDILNYASGYITNYKVIDTVPLSNKTLVIVDVWVNSSKLADRILGASTKPKEFAGETQIASLNNLLETKQKGRLLINQVMEGYPNNAINLMHETPQIEFQDGEPYIAIPLKLRWNYNWLLAFNETMSIMATQKNSTLAPIMTNLTGDYRGGYVTIIAKNPDNWVLGDRWTYRFLDNTNIGEIAGKIHHPFEGDWTQGYFLINFKDARESSVFKHCIRNDWLSSLAVATQTEVSIDNNTKLDLVARIELLPYIASSIKNASSVEVTMVAKKECK